MSLKWNYVDEIAKDVHVEKPVVANIVQLLKEDNTVPFIARYRQNLTGCLDAQKIRQIKEKIEDLKKVENKISSSLKLLSKNGNLNKRLEESILEATDIDVIEKFIEPFKTGSRITKVQKAKNLGLESVALKILYNEDVNLCRLIDKKIEGISSLKEVKQSLVTLAADIISKDSENVDKVQNWCNESNRIMIVSKKSGNISQAENANLYNFEKYFDFKHSIKELYPFIFLALKRGESLKILKLSIEIPDYIKTFYKSHCKKKYKLSDRLSVDNEQLQLLEESIQLAYDKHLEPRMCIQIKNKLKKIADQASIDSFASNLKNLLLTPPVMNKVIMGLDPGFTHGCKFAIINAHGEVLDTGVAYLHVAQHKAQVVGMNLIGDMLLKHKCEVIAVGNGVGCRETETLLSHHIKVGSFQPLNVMFCITSESGASIYSASDLAASELPTLDVTMRGAVSIARRLQDPLTELIKIDPKNLGVGMYQHDVSEVKLKRSLEGVVENCVSFVGVNVNLCSSNLLQHVAGIGPSLAENIIKKRFELGGQFTNRKQILLVDGLGPKKFKQLAGFLRIYVQSNQQTSVHPESYAIAEHLILDARLDANNIGEEHFISGFQSYIDAKNSKSLAESMNVDVETINQIVESLLQTTQSDIRDNYAKPLFRKEVFSIKSLFLGQRLCGRVTNVTDFGAFVDIGVGKDALIHKPGSLVLLNDCVEVEVINLDADRMRIGLKLIELRR
ncbi:hypothetical protein HELRODRAFT_187654 [Helobdella robusta]|uniref:S1 motif domain-containing protein n=1 Tax=Helobdella robusta TaxID=6412 RepID=T1FPB5_HELRO|nr:hypothetical protein HELRODRAFT_187654 [Helobdella robusta]ESN90057.1 hypothetical protein HELRODRAFT_187654 [Helobdella robusta]